MRYFKATLTTDKGKVHISTSAESMIIAINKISLVENCPTCAITAIKEIKQIKIK